MRRVPLADTLCELLDALAVPSAEGLPLRVDGVAFDVPLEVRVAGSGELLANLPRWRWPTDFDARPGRLHASFRSESRR
jgi:hypothetical protein